MSEKTSAATVSERAGDDCPLSAALQTPATSPALRAVVLIYLTGARFYVGVTHANLLHELGNSDTVANLPHACTSG